MKKTIALIIAMLLAIAFVMGAVAEDYEVEPGSIYSILYEFKKDGEQDIISDRLPDFYPGNHGLRLYYGAYIEAPVSVYMCFTEDKDVYWVCDYARLKDCVLRQSAFQDNSKNVADHYVWNLNGDVRREAYQYKVNGLPVKYENFMGIVMLYTSDENDNIKVVGRLTIMSKTEKGDNAIMRIIDEDTKKQYTMNKISNINYFLSQIEHIEH